jgi:ATP-dependent helicase HrpA
VTIQDLAGRHDVGLSALPAWTKSGFIDDGLIGHTGFVRLPRLVIYLRGIIHCIERLADNLGRDRGWMLEELRLSLFAQPLGAHGPISVQRIRKSFGD